MRAPDQISDRPDPFHDDIRLARQIGFVVEIDRLKHILRQTQIMDGSRRENDAEHSWHIAVMAMVLAEYAPANVSIARVLRMLLIHDLVEIDAGDTFVYDTAGLRDQAERERRAADRIFGLLPPDQAEEFRALWDEFEERRTPDAIFARAIDVMQPLLHNYHTQGGTWRQHGITADRVRARKSAIAAASPELWDYAQRVIEDAVRRGYLVEA
jgi:putative hydrolase of HD superfamily